MRTEILMDALNALPDEILEETASARSRQKDRNKTVSRRHAGFFLKTALGAACILLLCVGGLWVRHQRQEAGYPKLPMLPGSFSFDGGFGYEAYIARDISELVNANPWSEELQLTTLPVYKNTLELDEYFIPKGGSDLEKMKELLKETCDKFGLDFETLPIRDDVTESENKKSGKKTELTEEERRKKITYMWVETEEMEIAVNQELCVTVRFHQPLQLPEEYHITLYSTYEEIQEAGSYLLQEYREVLSMENPQINVSGGDYDIYGNQSYELNFFESCGESTDRIMQYFFRKVQFYPDVMGGGIYIIRFWNEDLSIKVGDYPIISVKEAKELLKKGDYVTSVPYEMPGMEYVKKVELVYITRMTEDYYMPYYRFLAELGEDSHQENMKVYGAYYVPAVDGRYLQDLTTYDGSIN